MVGAALEACRWSTCFRSVTLRKCSIAEVSPLFARYHGYGGVGGSATYCYGLFESKKLVAAFIWQPPAFGAAKSVCPDAPWAVLSLSRMVAVPRDERTCQKLSLVLRDQFNLIDRTRWPALITYSDEGEGHNGWVYRCARMKRTSRKRVKFYTDASGVRRSSLRNGKSNTSDLDFGGHTHINRWEHWVCRRDQVLQHVHGSGWMRVPVPGKKWVSGKQAHRIIHCKTLTG